MLSNDGRGMRLTWVKKEIGKVSNTGGSNWNKNNEHWLHDYNEMNPVLCFRKHIKLPNLTGTRVNHNKTLTFTEHILYAMLCSACITVCIHSFHSHAALWGRCYFSHYIYEEAEAWGRKLLCPSPKPCLTPKPFQLLCCMISHADISNFLSWSVI